jgi:hypothetical protein
MKILLFVITSICLAGCVNNQQPKTYTNKIKFYKQQALKVLYIQKEEKPVPAEYEKINFPDGIIAENRLNAVMFESLNENLKAFTPEVYKELEKNERIIKALKVEIAQEKEMEQELESLEKGIKQIKQRISKFKKNNSSPYKQREK